MQLDAFALSTTGRRAHNEDAVCARPDLGLFVVADGMGGYEGGEVASQVAVGAIEELVARTAGDADVTWPFGADPRLDPVARPRTSSPAPSPGRAAARIAAAKVGPLAQMGSTMVAIRIDPRRRLAVIGHVGDSRAYRLRGGRLERLTVDHSLWEELVAAGAAPAERTAFPYRHVITRALGTPHAEPELRVDALAPGDVFLLCSDGLSEVLADQVIAMRLADDRWDRDALVDFLASFIGGGIAGVQPSTWLALEHRTD